MQPDGLQNSCICQDLVTAEQGVTGGGFWLQIPDPKPHVHYPNSPLLLALTEGLQLQEGIDRVCLRITLYSALLFPQRTRCLLQPVHAVITPLFLKCSHPWGGVQPPLNSTQQEANSSVSDRNYLGNVGRAKQLRSGPGH